MSDGYFDRLESELAGLTGRGAHLDGTPRRVALVAARSRRATAALLVALLLAVSFVSEFPAVASGRSPAVAAVHG
jgi:hypothetical protein